MARSFNIFKAIRFIFLVLGLFLLLRTLKGVTFFIRSSADFGPTDGDRCDTAAMTRFSKRRAHMKEVCYRRKHDPLRTEWKVRLNFLLDFPSRLLVCAVPKSGSSSWHAIIWAIIRHRQGLDQDSVHYTHNDTELVKGIASRLNPTNGAKLIQPVDGDDDFSKSPPQNSSFRLILARHPFARFISGWNQKFSVESNYWVFLFKHYKQMLLFRKTPTEKHVLSINDFATFLVKYHGNGRYFDSHFHPAATLCKICEYDYTYVLKAESLEADERWLMNKMNLGDIIIQRMGVGPEGGLNHTNVKESIRQYMSLLQPDIIRRLYKLYEADFDFFGYTFNFTTLEAGGFE